MYKKSTKCKNIKIQKCGVRSKCQNDITTKMS